MKKIVIKRRNPALKRTAASAVALSLLFSLGTIAALRASAADLPATVRLGGQPFGVKFYNDGVMVVELEEFYSGGRYVCPAKEGGLQESDVIKKVNDNSVGTNEDVQAALSNSGGSPVRFTVVRDGKELVKTVVPQQNTAGQFLLGAWVRDSCAGIGTVTFYDDEHHYFAALGHGICDSDTAALMPLGSAEVVKARVNSVTKSSTGKAGSLNGYFSGTALGSLTKNTPCGVFGTVSDSEAPAGTTLPLAENSEIKVGEAQLYTTLEGDEAGCYTVEITEICNTDAQSNENFVIKVTDVALLQKCGGIVQGMSGSPLVQNGKLVGAVTHVFLNSPQEGYGITAQNMASNYQE